MTAFERIAVAVILYGIFAICIVMMAVRIVAIRRARRNFGLRRR